MKIRNKYINTYYTPIGIVKNFILKDIKIPNEVKEYIGEYIFSKKFCNYNYDVTVHYETFASSNTIATTIYHKIPIQYDKFTMNFIQYVLLQHFKIKSNRVVIPQYKKDVNYLISNKSIYYYIVDQFIYYNKLVYFMMLNIIHKYIYQSNSFIISMINNTHEMNYELRHILDNYKLQWSKY